MCWCCCRCEPNEPCSPSALRKLGVLSWKLDADNHEADPRLAAIRKVRGYSYTVRAVLQQTHRLGALSVGGTFHSSSLRSSSCGGVGCTQGCTEPNPWVQQGLNGVTWPANAGPAVVAAEKAVLLQLLAEQACACLIASCARAFLIDIVPYDPHYPQSCRFVRQIPALNCAKSTKIVDGALATQQRLGTPGGMHDELLHTCNACVVSCRRLSKLVRTSCPAMTRRSRCSMRIT